MWGLEQSWGRAGEGREGARGETGGATLTDEIGVVYGAGWGGLCGQMCVNKKVRRDREVPRCETG